MIDIQYDVDDGIATLQVDNDNTVKEYHELMEEASKFGIVYGKEGDHNKGFLLVGNEHDVTVFTIETELYKILKNVVEVPIIIEDA